MSWASVQDVPARHKLVIYKLLQNGVIGYSKDALTHYQLQNAIDLQTNVMARIKGIKKDIIKNEDFKDRYPLVYESMPALQPKSKSEREIQDGLARALFTWIDAGEGLKKPNDDNKHEIRERQGIPQNVSGIGKGRQSSRPSTNYADFFGGNSTHNSPGNSTTNATG